jgi:Endonuclease-reverse transcriptase
LIRKDIPYRILNLDTPLQAVACRISTPQPVSLCSVYLPPTSSWNHSDLLVLLSKLPPPVLLIGDFNSHSTLWGCSSTNRKGHELETLLLQSNLCLLNDKSPTYLHPETGSLSSLDLAFSDPSIVLNYSWPLHKEYSAMQFRSTPDSSRASRVRIPSVDTAFGLASNNLLTFVWKTEAYAELDGQLLSMMAYCSANFCLHSDRGGSLASTLT